MANSSPSIGPSPLLQPPSSSLGLSRRRRRRRPHPSSSSIDAPFRSDSAGSALPTPDENSNRKRKTMPPIDQHVRNRFFALLYRATAVFVSVFLYIVLVRDHSQQKLSLLPPSASPTPLRRNQSFERNDDKAPGGINRRRYQSSLCVLPGGGGYSFVHCPLDGQYEGYEYEDRTDEDDGLQGYHRIYTDEKQEGNGRAHDNEMEDDYMEDDYISDGVSTSTCRPPQSWHKRQYPTCNIFHERWGTVAANIFKIDEGFSTEVFELRHDNVADVADEHRWVFKLNLLSKGDFEHDAKRDEAILLEHLSASPFIPSIYGFCGTSTLNPLASSGTLYDLIKSIRFGGQDLLDKGLDTLKISVQVASGLAALHDANGDGRPAFAHNDLDVSQYVYNADLQVYQLNDLNKGHFIAYDSEGRQCKVSKSNMGPWKYRAPEDLFATIRRGPPFNTDKADVYSLGVVMYMVLTNMWLWEYESREQSAERIIRGKRPPLPDDIKESTDDAIWAVINAIDMCWIYDPEERASAEDVAHYLWDALELIRPWEEVNVILPQILDDVMELDDDYDPTM